MNIDIYYWDRLAFKAMLGSADPETGTVLNRIAITDAKGNEAKLWLDEHSARALQAALAKLYPDQSEDAALDQWASEHEGEFARKEVA